MSKLIYEHIPQLSIKKLKPYLNGQSIIHFNCQNNSYTVQIAYSACHFGGSRPWFICPCCGHRMASLLFYNHKFGCRHCLNTCYSIENKSPIDRQRLREQRLLNQLGCATYSELIWFDSLRKPKGMHLSSFERKKQIISTVHSQKAQLLNQFHEHLLAQENQYQNKVKSAVKLNSE